MTFAPRRRPPLFLVQTTRRRSRRRAVRALFAALLALSSASAVSLQSGQALGQPKDPKTSHPDEIGLAVGETKTISAAGVRNYSEGVPGVIDVRLTPEGNQFVIVGKKPGTTTLLLIKNDGSQVSYDIAVALRSPQAVERELQQLLEGTTGLRVRRIGGRLFIEGGVPNDAEFRRVQQVASLYPGQVESLVTVGQGAAEKKILIRLDFFFVQYERTSSFAVGLGWPTQIGGVNAAGLPVFQNNISYDLIGRTTTSAQASVVNQPLPSLDIGSKHGWLRILKQSSVITSNGADAVFNNGGEQNYLQTVGLTTGLVKVLFGTNVNVLPRYDSATRDVEVKLSADVADLTPAAAAGGIPGRTTAKLETLVTLKLGQALILSGIRTQTRRHDVSGLPLLSEIPVLGVLFGSHKNDEQDVEGAVFIIPSVIETVPKSALEIIKNAMSTFNQYSGDIESVEAYPKTPPSAK